MSLRIGILGAARVAAYAMIEAARSVDGLTVAAVAARDKMRARAYAAVHGIPRVLDSYAALIEDADIHAVYVALPPNLHARWAIAAVAAGKPVLCEKPFALCPADVAAMLAAEAAHGTLIMEAQHSHYHLLAARMRDLVGSGALGEIVTADAWFSTHVPATPGEIRYDRAVGGGALWDLGVYPAYWLRRALGDTLTPVSASQRWVGDDRMTGADIATTAMLAAASGASVRLHCDMGAPTDAGIALVGAGARLDITNPLAPQRGHRLTLTRGTAVTHEEFDGPSTYQGQLAAFRDAVVSGAAVPTRGVDSLATIDLLTAIDTLARQDPVHAD